jgi:hypothetical protein
MAAGLQKPLQQLRKIARELRLVKINPVHKSKGMVYILNQFRKHEVTQEQQCKHQAEMQFLADTYGTYLASQREWKELNDYYHARGERSVADTAKMVGFNLPHEPKIERRPRKMKDSPKTDG